MEGGAEGRRAECDSHAAYASAPLHEQPLRKQRLAVGLRFPVRFCLSLAGYKKRILPPVSAGLLRRVSRSCVRVNHFIFGICNWICCHVVALHICSLRECRFLTAK